MSKLDSAKYMKFPFAIGAEGASESNRSAHIREQVEQVLFTSPRERVFRPEFGAGIVRLTFEPNNTALWELTRKRLYASLAEALGPYPAPGGIYALPWPSAERCRAMGDDLVTGLQARSDAAVRLMTVHASKGLEAPVVVLAEVSRVL